MKVHLPKLVAIIALIFTIGGAKAQAPTVSYSPSTQSYTDGTAIATWTPTTGGTPVAEYSIPVVYQGLTSPYGISTPDAAGNIYGVDNLDGVLYQYTPAGAVNVIDGGSFYLPTSVTVDKAHNVMYVTDGANIFKYSTTTGALLVQLTDYDAPNDIALDASGNLFYVTQDNILKKLPYGFAATATPTTITLTPSGISSAFGIAISGNDIYISEGGAKNDIVKIANGVTGSKAKTTFATGFNNPSHMTVYAGNLYVADNGSGNIKKVSTTTGVVTNFLSGLNAPLGVAFDNASPNPNFYETEDGGSGFINKSSYGKYSINTPLPAGLVFNTSTGVITGTPNTPSQPTQYVVSVYNASGNSSFTITVGVVGVKPNIVYTPNSNTYATGTAIPNWTPTNSGGTVHSASFGSANTISGGNLSGPRDMAVDPSGNVYVANSTNGTISEYNSAGVWITDNYGGTFGTPYALAFDAAGNGYVADGTNSIIYKIAAGTGTKTVFLNGATDSVIGPWAITTDASGNVYVVNNSNNNVTKYDKLGNKLLTIKGGAGNGPGLVGPVAVVVDGSGNVYVLDYGLDAGPHHLVKYSPLGKYLSTLVNYPNNSFNPLGLAIDGAGNLYVTDQGSGGANSDPTTGVVNVYNPSGTLFTTVTGLSDPRGATVDAAGNLYVPDYSNDALYQFMPNAGYFISAALPPGLSFNNNTGTISGTPTSAFPATVYTVTAYNTSGSSSFNITISCTATSFDWIGGTAGATTNWGTATNWSGGAVPTSVNTANIGVNVAFSVAPVISPTTTPGNVDVAGIVLGTNGGRAASITVTNAGGNFRTLNVSGALVYQSDAGSAVNANTYAPALSGTGTVTANSINVTANTAGATAYTETLTSSVANLTVSDIYLTSSSSTAAHNATFTISAGIDTVSNKIHTINTGTGTSTFALLNGSAKLELKGATALSDLSATGTNVVTFNATGATVEYSGDVQTIYTDAAITGLPGGVSYQNIAFSGTGIKTALAGNLNVPGNFTNNMVTDATDLVDFTLPTVQFNGTSAQSLTGVAASSTKFSKVTFSGNSTKTMSIGQFAISSKGILTMGGTSATNILNAGSGLLTLNSNVNASATVAAITNSQSIKGTVNVQRYISGNNDNTYRGYRLLSSPVSVTGVSPFIYSINYLQLSSYITGAAGGGFDVPATTNPTLYLFREDLTPSNASFTGGNFQGISKISSSPNYGVNGSGSYNLAAGSGYLFFFRGDRAVDAIGTETVTSYAPTNTTLTATGYLNQGPITARPWYTGGATLGFTGSGPGTNFAVRGFNLVGNPYASSIDWDTYATSGTTGIVAGGTPISKSMYILDPVSKNYSIYVAGTASKAGTIVLNNANIIPSGQGFFVIASDATSTLTFNESAKTNGQASAATGNLLLSTQPLAVKVDQYLHLMLKKDTLNVDGLLINFNDNAKSKFDISKDAPYKIGSGIASLSSRSADSVALSINTLSLPKQGQTVIGLNISAKTDGIYQLNMQSIKSLPAVYEVWLMDAYKKDSLDVRQNPTYSFNITNSDAASFGAKRFSLVIRQNAGLGVKLVNFTATKSSNGVQTIWTTKNEQNYTNFTIERSNDNGKTFEVVGGTGSSAVGTYSLVDKEPLAPADQYRLKIEDLNGNITYSDIVTIQYSNLSNNIVKNGVSIYPNPATSTIKLSITKTTSNVALYGIEIVNNRGAVIKTAVSTQPDWQSDVTGLMPGSYIIRVINNTDRSLIARGTFIKL